MLLPTAVTVNDLDGVPVTLTEVDVLLIDHEKTRRVFARLSPCPKLLVLWEGAEYDAAGDYTQEQALDRVRELLGDDPQAVIQSLYTY